MNTQELSEELRSSPEARYLWLQILLHLISFNLPCVISYPHHSPQCLWPPLLMDQPRCLYDTFKHVTAATVLAAFVSCQSGHLRIYHEHLNAPSPWLLIAMDFT